MEFFKNAGNWFRGAFGGESEEEKKRKRLQQQKQQQKPKPQQTLPKQKPTTMNDLFGKKQNPATQAPSFTQPKPIKPETKPQPKAVVPLSVPETQRQAGIPQKFNFDEKEAKTISDGFKKGTVSKQQYVDYTKKAAENAKKKMTNGKVTFQNVVDSTVATGVSMAQDIPRAVMTLANTKAGVKEYKPQNTIERFFFGDAPVKDATGYAKETINAFDPNRKSDGTGVADKIPPALLLTLGVVLAASDLAPGGKTKKTAAEEAIKLTEKQLGRKLTTEEIDQARKAAQDTVGTPAAPDTRVERENQRLADEAIARNKEMDGISTNEPAYQRGYNDPQSKYRQAQSNARGEGNPMRDMQDQGLNPGDPTDVPSFYNKNGDKMVSDSQKKIDEINGQLDKTPEQHIEEYKFNQKQKLAEDIRANPSKKDALIAAYNARIATAGNLENLTSYRAGLMAQKADLEAQIAYTKQMQAQTTKTVDEAGAKTAEDIAAQQKVVDEVQAAKEEAQAPVNPVADPALKTETAANDGYRPTTEEVLFPNAPEANVRDDLNIPQRISPDRIIRENITRPIENATDRLLYKAQTSGNKVARGIGRFFTGFSRELGVTPEMQTAKMGLRGGVEKGKMYRETIADLSKKMKPESKERIWATLDPEQAAKKGIDPTTVKLTPEESVLRDKLKVIIDNTTQENLRRGLITPEQAAAGSYIKRSYTIYDGNTDVPKFEAGFRQELLGQFKGRKEVSDEMAELAVTDPTYLVGKKTAESNAIWAMQDYGNFLVKSGNVSSVEKAGFTKLPDSPVFGKAAGQYVPRNVAEDFTGFQYNWAMVDKLNEVFQIYDRWNVRQAKKQILTIFNPAVRAGNQITNRGIFSNLNGINPIQFNAKSLEVDNMIAQGHPLYREAVENGLTGVDISQAEFFAQRIAQSAGNDKNIFKKAIEWAQTSYSGADDKARITAYVIHRERGYPAEEAARMTQRGFQDYKSVGFFYDLAAKTPILGNAFVRFAADSVRIAKNAAVDHPMRSLATIAAWSAFVNGMSVLSGESELKGENELQKGVNLVTGESKSDAQKAREDRFGAPKLPFTDISSTVQTPWGEVNAARFMPWYNLNEIGGEVTKFLPYQQSPVVLNEEKNGLEFNGGGFADPLLGQIFQLATDKDFRNKSIQDPENTGQLNRDPLSTEEKLKNVARFLGVGNAPVGKEIDALYSAATGQPDLYGKERSIWQALIRSAGVKVEQYGDKQLQDNADRQAYFADLKQIEEELKGMSPDAQSAYKRLTGYDKMREKVPNEFEEGSMRYKKAAVYDFGEDKWKDYAAHPEIYKLMVDKKQREFAKDGKPIQPEFDPRLPEDFRRQLIQNKMVAPGDDAELDQRMYSSPEWDYYSELKKIYKEKAKAYYPQGDDEFVDELVKHQDADFPEKPDVLKQYGAAYAAYTDGKAPGKPEFTDEVKAAKEAYNKQTFDWTNTERKARGLPAIVWDMWNNPTFGYDSTPSGSGSGWGSGWGSGGGGSEKTVNNLGELTNFSNDISRLTKEEAAAMPDLARLFAALQAGQGGGKAKPKIGASSRGQ